MRFKVGDKVHAKDHNISMSHGVVKRIIDRCRCPYLVRDDGGSGEEEWFDDNELQPRPDVGLESLKVGDRVRVNFPLAEDLHGKAGSVIKIRENSEWRYRVLLDDCDDRDLVFRPSRLELIKAPKPLKVGDKVKLIGTVVSLDEADSTRRYEVEFGGDDEFAWPLTTAVESAERAE
jgi:hypothetical protein